MNERDDMDLTPEERELRSALRGLGEVRADDAFRAKLRQQFVSGEFATGTPTVVAIPRRRDRARRGGMVGALIAVAAALAIIFVLPRGDSGWQLKHLRGDGVVTVNGRELPTTERAQLAKMIAPDARIAVSEGVELDAVLGDVMVVGVAGPAEFTLAALPDGAPYVYRSEIQSGEFRIKTGPGFPGREALLTTSDGRIVITGTTVAVLKMPDLTCVCVLEGTAEIGRDADHMDAIPAGMRKVMFTDGRDPLIVAIEPDHKQGLLEFESYNRDTFK